MIYKVTLLKDLPQYPAGTVFHGVEYDHEDKKWIVPYHDWYAFDIASLIDNPVWCKKELDPTCLIDVRCPKCANTKISLSFVGEDPQSDDDVFYYSSKLVAQCEKCLYRYSLGAWIIGSSWGRNGRFNQR